MIGYIKPRLNFKIFSTILEYFKYYLMAMRLKILLALWQGNLTSCGLEFTIIEFKLYVYFLTNESLVFLFNLLLNYISYISSYFICWFILL